EYFCTFAVSSGSPFSNANTVLCSAPWYSYTRRMSFHSETPHTNSRNIAIRMSPSTRLNTICCPKTGFTFFSSVVASRGRYLYMKMKKATEKAMFTPAIQPVISNFLPWSLSSGSLLSGSWADISSSAALAENLSARNPSVIAFPSVITPRTTGQPIHLCWSEGRSSGSLWVTISPEGLRTAMPQACGDRIITPSSTAWPPTSVSSPLSRAGSNWTAARKRKNCRQRRIVIGWYPGEERLQLAGYHGNISRKPGTDRHKGAQPALFHVDAGQHFGVQ